MATPIQGVIDIELPRFDVPPTRKEHLSATATAALEAEITELLRARDAG